MRAYVDKIRDDPGEFFWMDTFKLFSVNQRMTARRSFLGEAMRLNIFILQFFTGILQSRSILAGVGVAVV